MKAVKEVRVPLTRSGLRNWHQVDDVVVNHTKYRALSSARDRLLEEGMRMLPKGLVERFANMNQASDWAASLRASEADGRFVPNVQQILINTLARKCP